MATYSPDFMKEILYEPSDEELGNIEAGPGKVASVGGLLGRFARKIVADPVRGMYRAVEKARTGKFKDQEEAGKAALEFAGNMAGTPGFGSGLGSGARVAVPWQSRTLDTVLGHTPAGKKMPDAATPQTWMSKLKGAGLPKEEMEVVQGFLDTAEPRGKLDRRQLANAISGGDVRQLPEMGVTTTVLGGPEFFAGQKRMEELAPLINEASRRHRELIRTNTPRFSPEFLEASQNYRNLIQEQQQLATKEGLQRPRWPQYNIEGLENPREVLYHGKPKSGETEYINSDMELHYGQDKGKNLIFHQREGELKLPDGKKSTHISEQQSDWHSEFASGGKPLEISDSYAAHLSRRLYNGWYDNDTDMMRRALNEIGIETSHVKDNEIKSLIEDEIGTGFITGDDSGIRKTFTEYNRNKNKVPEPPMKDTWHKTGFKDTVKRAVEAGHDYVTWDTADTQIKRWPAGEGAEKYFRGHYDDKLVKFAAKEYGVKPEKVNTKEAIVADVPVLPRADKPNTTSVQIDPDFIAVANVPGSRDRYYLRVPEIGSQYSSGFRVDNRIFNSYDEGWAAREEFISQLEKFKGPDRDSTEVWRIPITEDMKRKVLLEGQYWTKKDKAATPGGRNAEGIA
jgi:hypothetical protein